MRTQAKRVGWRELLAGLETGKLRLHSYHGRWWTTGETGEKRNVAWPTVAALRKHRTLVATGMYNREWSLSAYE